MNLPVVCPGLRLRNEIPVNEWIRIPFAGACEQRVTGRSASHKWICYAVECAGLDDSDTVTWIGTEAVRHYQACCTTSTYNTVQASKLSPISIPISTH